MNIAENIKTKIKDPRIYLLIAAIVLTFFSWLSISISVSSDYMDDYDNTADIAGLD